jgi:CRISPR-associated endonuclease/helicase Cas3
LYSNTQPAINDLLPKVIKPIEIMNNPRQLYEDFKKVQVKNIGEL